MDHGSSASRHEAPLISSPTSRAPQKVSRLRARIRRLLVLVIQVVSRMLHKLQRKRFVHVLHIGKTGGTAVKTALRDVRDGGYVFYLHRHEVTLKDVPPGELVIFFTRDPIARFLSGFYSRQRQGRPRIFSRWTEDEVIAFSHFETPNELAEALGSTDEEERKRAHHAMKSIGHVRSHYWDWFGNEEYFMSRLSDIVFIGRQEDLNAEFERLKRILELPESVRLPADDVESHRNPRGLDKRLTEAAVENLTRWYGEDYAFLDLCQKVSAGTSPKQS